MEQWLRDSLAAEQGYTICPIRFETYTRCNNNCSVCPDYIDFKKSVEESRLFNEKN